MPTATAHCFAFERLFVLLDITTDHRQLLQTALALGRQIDAQVVVIYLEDPRIQALEAHPYARAIDGCTFEGCSLGRGQLRRQSTARIRRIEHLIEQEKRRIGAKANFRQIEAQAREQLVELVGAQDALVVEQPHRRGRLTRQPHALEVARGLQCAMLYVRRRGLLPSVITLGRGPS